MDWKLLVLCAMCILVIGGCIYTVVVETKSYQKGLNNKEEIENIIKAVNTHIGQDNIRYDSLDKRIAKLEPKPIPVNRATGDDYFITTSYATKETVEKMINEKIKNNDAELVHYKVENAALKKEIEECRKLLKEKSENIKQLSTELIVEQCKSRAKKGENNV